MVRYTEMRNKNLVALLVIMTSAICFIVFAEGGLHLLGVRPLAQDSSVSIWDQFPIELDTCEHSDFQKVQDFCRPRPNQGEPILAFGGSSLVWAADDHEPNFLDLANKSLKPYTKIYFENYGLHCKDSYFIHRCYQSLKKTKPRTIFIYAGHNDLINIGYINTKKSIFLRRYPRFTAIAFFLQSHSRLYTLNSKLLYNLASPSDRLAHLTVEDLERRQKFIVSRYRQNIEQIIKKAQKEGTLVLLATTISNLKIPPLHAYETQYLQSPANLKAQKHYQNAKKYFEYGQYEEALKQFIMAKDYDPQGNRALSEMNNTLRELATHYDHVKLIDFEAYFHQKKEEGLGCNYFGNDLYCDHHHPNLIAKKIMAEILSKFIMNETIPNNR